MAVIGGQCLHFTYMEARFVPDGADPRVGVVMITYNRREEVIRSLGHLSRLAERPRITLVDNGSCDGTDRAVAEAYPHVTVLRQERNLGAATRTVGVRQAEAPYIALCDDDTWWAPGCLRRAADVFDAHLVAR
jgi:GT2 family glycosyltransferase